MAENQLKKREEISREYLWKLEDMYASDDLWEEECKKVEELCKELGQFAGTLGKSADALLSYWKKHDELEYYLDRVFSYANQRYDQDTADTKYQGFLAKAQSIAVAAGSADSFAAPELLSIDGDTLERFYGDNPALSDYRRAMDEIRRTKDHILSAAEERIMAETGEMASAPKNAYFMLNNADLKFPAVADSAGNEVAVTHGNYISLLNSRDRTLRERAFGSLYETYGKFGNTVASMFTANLNQESFRARMRGYGSTRAMHLDNGNIPESVYDNLIETVHKHLPALHRYMKIRKEMLGVEELHMYDIYVPLLEDLDVKYTFEQAKETVEKALAPMGEEYVSILKEGFAGGWIDVFENENKRSGAYSTGTYGTHPYVLLNHQEDMDSMFTLAHEMGHAIHTYYSCKNQPITYSQYLIFVAEVASTCNEALLYHYLLENEQNAGMRRYIVNHYLEGFRTTLFRQTMFAEFEMIVHRKLAEGESLTMESLNAIYHDLNVLYYGPDVVADALIDFEWMRIPHFYTAFYVYQYATGFSAAVAFCEKILKEGQPAVERYVNRFLSGGCSKDPIDLLADAGVDMRTPQPVDDALAVFEQYLDIFAEDAQ